MNGLDSQAYLYFTSIHGVNVCNYVMFAASLITMRGDFVMILIAKVYYERVGRQYNVNLRSNYLLCNENVSCI